MRVALCIIIIFLGSTVHNLKTISDSLLGALFMVGYIGLLYDYLKSKK